MPHSAQTVEDLFEAALDLPPEDRGRFLEAACAGRPELRHATEQLFAELDRAGSFLQTPVLEPAPDPPSLPAAQPPRFAPGDLIAHRFIIVAFLARGGMGEVYEVEDLWLHGTHVALKVIRPEIAADAGSSRRFEHEVLLARKVTHPNLCPIYEIFRCNDPAPPFLFLTMKLLRGETLATRLRASPPLLRAEREHICRELLRGVAALHAGGIIHRDLKPGNIMLETGSPFPHLSLMDFGLARLKEAEPTLLAPDAGLVVAGTPGYLAPELLRGDAPSEATDCFALGVVLHQVLTGEKPHPTSSSSHSVTTLLRAADVSPTLIRTVEDLLSDTPDRRCQAFQRSTRTLDTPRPHPFSPLLTRRAVAFGSLTALGALATGVAWKRDTLADLFHPLPLKRFVALVSWPPGSDLTLRSLLNGVLEAIAGELTRAEAIDHNFYIAAGTSSELSTPDQLDQLRTSLGANLVLAASGLTSGNTVRLLLQVLDPTTRNPLRSRTLEATRDHLLTLPATAVRAATELLDLHRFQPDPDRTEPGTTSHEALAVFQTAETLVKHPNDTGLDEAIEKYRVATELDPHFAQAHARLALAYTHLFGMRHVASALTLARANAETALVLDPNSIAARTALAIYFDYSGLAANALDQIARALALDPTNPFTMLTQAQICSDLGRWPEAEAAFSRLIRARPNDWRGYNELGVVLNSQGRYAQALTNFQAATALAPNRAACIDSVARALFELGRLPEALAAADKALALQRNNSSLQIRTYLLRLSGKPAEALTASQEAVTLSPDDSTTWIDLGDSYTLLGRANRHAGEAYARAVTIQTQALNTDAADGLGWLTLALAHLKLGNTAAVPALLVRADSLGTPSIDSQLVKLRIQELLGQREAALDTLAAAVRRGATRFQIQPVVDLAPLRADPRYAAIFAGRQPS